MNRDSKVYCINNRLNLFSEWTNNRRSPRFLRCLAFPQLDCLDVSFFSPSRPTNRHMIHRSQPSWTVWCYCSCNLNWSSSESQLLIWRRITVEKPPGRLRDSILHRNVYSPIDNHVALSMISRKGADWLILLENNNSIRHSPHTRKNLRSKGVPSRTISTWIVYCVETKIWKTSSSSCARPFDYIESL
jgi:hypothetical protein